MWGYFKEMAESKKNSGSDFFIFYNNETIRIMKQIDEVIEAHGG